MEKWISPWINVTDMCNCKCKYCYVSDDNSVMKEEIFCKLNEYIIKKIEAKELGYCKYRIAGGEPLIVLDKWFEPAKKYLDMIKNRGGIEILSNFTIYPDKLDILLSHDNYCNINISLDSTTTSKPYKDGRSSSFDTMRNIDKYKKRYNKKPFIMTVVTEDGKYLPELAKYIISIDAKWEIQVNKDYEKDFNCGIVNNNITEVLNIFKKRKYSVDNILYNFCDLQATRECENGRTMFAIMQNGDVRNCQMQFDKIGNFLKTDLLTLLNKNKTCKTIKDDKCKGCVIYKYCHGDCPNKNQDKKRMHYICKIMKHYVLCALRLKKEELNA